MKKASIILGIFMIFGLYSWAAGHNEPAVFQLKDEINAPGYSILAVSCLSFKPLTSEEYQTYSWEFNEIGLTVPSGNPHSLDLMAPFSLPDGAVIKKVIVLYYDNSASADIDILMNRVYATDTGSPETMVYLTSEGTGNYNKLRSLSTSSITNPTIDNTYIYILSVSLDSTTNLDVSFRGVWILYQ